MAKEKKTRSTGTKTEVFAMRLDPRLKYLAELAARKQRRSLANFVEWAIEEALTKVKDVVPADKTHFRGDTIADLAPDLWALEESDRLVALAQCCPDLMSYDEQLIWRVIREHWVREKNTTYRFVEGKRVLTTTVRACWPQLKAYALGNGTKEALDAVLRSEYDLFPPEE